MVNFGKMRFTIHLKAKFALLLLLVSGGIGLGAVSDLVPMTMAAQTGEPKPLTRRQLAKYQKTFQQQIESILNLVGLGKLSRPPEFSETLQAYRNERAKSDPDTAAFLGLWVNEWEPFPPFLFLSIFPSEVKGKVCIIEYIDTQDPNPIPGEKQPPNPPPKFSTARIIRGQLVGEQLWLDKSLIRQVKEEWMTTPIEFLGAVNRQKELQLYASKKVAELDPILPAEVLEAFKTNRCYR